VLAWVYQKEEPVKKLMCQYLIGECDPEDNGNKPGEVKKVSYLYV
jgi:hypothetical protein